MTPTDHLQLMQRTLAAFARGDIAELSRLFAPDVVWIVPGRHRVAGTFRGQAEVFGYFASLMQLSAGTFTLAPIDAFANARGGVFIDRATAERDGRRLDDVLALHVTIRDGRIVEGRDFFHDAAQWDAFWR